MDNLEVSNRSNSTTDNNEIISAQDAHIEAITLNNRNGFVTISYGIMGKAGMIHVELVKLVVIEDTIILDVFGSPIPLRNLRIGMRVDADFSARMTRSIPPQSVAFRIIVKPEGNFMNVKIDRVVSVDTENGFLYTGDPREISDQMRFVVTDATDILDRRGNPIPLNRIRPGQLVKVEHATFQTASIPPQTTAFRIQLL
jgi:hypothetical protein